MSFSRSLFSAASVANATRSITTTASPIASTSLLSPYSIPNGAIFSGIVTGVGKMTKTTTVTVERQATDHKTLKQFLKHKKFLVHDPDSLSVVGDKVEIRHCTPVSKRKHFELLRISKGASTRTLVKKDLELKEGETRVA